MNQLEPLTEQQSTSLCNLQQSAQQAEDALSQGMKALQQSLAETFANGSLGPLGSSGNIANYMGQMAMAMGKLGTLEGFLCQAARQLEFLKGRSNLRPNTDMLVDALAIAQHHDAVTGTEKQHVANDYAKRLSIGYKEAEELVASSLACLVESTNNRSCGKFATKFEQVAEECDVRFYFLIGSSLRTLMRTKDSLPVYPLCLHSAQGVKKSCKAEDPYE